MLIFQSVLYLKDIVFWLDKSILCIKLSQLHHGNKDLIEKGFDNSKGNWIIIRCILR